MKNPLKSKIINEKSTAAVESNIEEKITKIKDIKKRKSINIPLKHSEKNIMKTAPACDIDSQFLSKKNKKKTSKNTKEIKSLNKIFKKEIIQKKIYKLSSEIIDKKIATKNKSIGTLVGNQIERNIQNKIIIGIDPGLKFLGIGIIEIDPQIFITIEKDHKEQIKAESLIPLITQYTHLLLKIKTNKGTPEKLHFIYETLDKIIEKHTPDLIIVEDSFVGINKNSAIKLGLARGSILTVIGKHKVRIENIAPKRIKMEVTQRGDAQKEDIEQFFEKNLENWKNNEKLDSTDALAASFCGIKYFIDDFWKN